MMTVEEYAEDIKRDVEIILGKCNQLGLDAKKKDDSLDEYAITELDNIFVDEEETPEEIVNNFSTKVDVSPTKLEKITKKVVPRIRKNNKNLANKKKAMYKNKEKLMSNNDSDGKYISYRENMTVGELAEKLDVTATEVVKKLFLLGTMATVNNKISYDDAEIIVSDYKKELKTEESLDVTNFEEYEIIDNEEDLKERPPVVTIMGHVDHGKTTLLDTIRKSNVVDSESGGITQAINAYQIKYNDKKITFIDTPGHAAFTKMRVRGASVTDIVIIIVAADDGVMPQTKEAIDHAKAAEVPIIVVINKIDKPGANIDKVKKELTECGLAPEEWGGETLYNEVSALNNIGIDELLENILLLAEMNQYKANSSRYAVGTVIESKLDKHVGPVVTLLISNGTLRLGDPLVVGTVYGKIRTLKNDLNVEITEAYPSMPVEITGLTSLPEAGDKFMAFETDKQAKNISITRIEEKKKKDFCPKDAVNIEDLFAKISSGLKEINVLVKADYKGSAEAIKGSLENIKVEEVGIKIVRCGVGAITESDIVLAKASNSIIIGFNLRPPATIRECAKENCVEIRLYSIIYNIVDEMEAAMKGMLEPIFEEKVTGQALVRQLFKFSKVGIIAGCYIQDGLISKTDKVRVIRNGIVVYDGVLKTIQREKDSVKNIKKGLECGITIEDFNDVKENDILEAYKLVEIKR